ncbi:MAG: hypothetical protein GEU99_03170 [Luteitalea sp.]|nr:hypothetical protein [Luteitalea sp.]
MSLLATWVWQGVVLTLAVAGVLRLWRPGAATRTFVWWATLLAVLGVPVSWLGLRSAGPRVADLRAGGTATGLAIPIPHDALVSVAIGVWLGGVLLGLLTLAYGFVKLRRVKARCSPLGSAREERLNAWIAARNGRSARLCVSEDVAVASALGLGSPVIAVNASLAHALDDRELDQLVLHEYAHLQRFDDWTQLVQAIVETFCGLHPAIWWIGRALRFERESAADEWVVHRTQSPHEYASCLATIASMTLVADGGGLVPGAGGLGMGAGLRRGDLLRRVERILRSGARPVQRIRPMAYATTVAALVTSVIGLRQLPVLVHLVDAPASEEAVIHKARREAGLLTLLDAGRVQPGLLEVARTPRGHAEPRPASPKPPVALGVPTLRARTAAIATSIPALGTSVTGRRLPRAKSRGLDNLATLRSTAFDGSALTPAGGEIRVATSPRGVGAILGSPARDRREEATRHWLGLPTLATRTSKTATDTATAIAKTTAENAVSVGGALVDFGKVGAARSVGWFRRRLGIGSKPQTQADVSRGSLPPSSF